MRIMGAAALMLMAGPAAADGCSLLLFKDDLPNCVKELQSKISLLEATLWAEQSQNRLHGVIICNLALSINKSAPSEDNAATMEAACAETKERAAAAQKRGKPKAKTTP